MSFSRLLRKTTWVAQAWPWAGCSVSMRAAEVAGWVKMRLLLLLLVTAAVVVLNQPGWRA